MHRLIVWQPCGLKGIFVQKHCIVYKDLYTYIVSKSSANKLILSLKKLTFRQIMGRIANFLIL